MSHLVIALFIAGVIGICAAALYGFHLAAGAAYALIALGVFVWSVWGDRHDLGPKLACAALWPVFIGLFALGIVGGIMGDDEDR